jgi:hypothetical protein
MGELVDHLRMSGAAETYTCRQQFLYNVLYTDRAFRYLD